VCVCLLFCFIKPILGNHYGPGISWRAKGACSHDWESPTYLVTLSFIRQPGGSRIFTLHLQVVATCECCFVLFDPILGNKSRVFFTNEPTGQAPTIQNCMSMFLFLFVEAATPLTLQLHHEHIRKVRCSMVAWKRLARIEWHSRHLHMERSYL